MFHRSTVTSALLCLPIILQAAVINIPDDTATIQGGIDMAQMGDTVLVQPGTWEELLDFQGSGITVASLWLTTGDENYIETTTIDASENGSVVSFLSGETEAAVLCGFTVSGGRGAGTSPDYQGGGITCRDGSSPSLHHLHIQGNNTIGEDGHGGGLLCSNAANPHLEQITFSFNDAHRGGAIAVIDASPRFQDVTIDTNSAYCGAGFYCTGSASPTLVDVTISNNQATGDAGGGVCCENQASPLFQNVTITGNLSDWNGGGIAILDLAEPLLTDVMVVDNSAAHAGGGVYCQNGQAVLAGCEVNGNRAFLGAGVYGRDLAGLQLDRVLLSDNQSNVDGGAVYCDNATLMLQNVTMAENSADWFGGAVYLRGATELELSNCIVWGNSIPQVYSPEFGASSNLICGCSDLEGGENSIETSDNCTVNWLEHNLASDPQFCDAANEDFRLQLSSPCRTEVCSFMGFTGETCDGEQVPSVRAPPGSGSPGAIVLTRNYPNPFNPTTTIEFRLACPQEISLSVYNVMGQSVGVPVKGRYNAGVHQVQFDGSKLTSGVYLCRLLAGRQLSTRKMILLK